MEIRCHGGKCCGITHIEGMGWGNPKTAQIGAQKYNGIENFATHAYPGEKGGQFSAPTESYYDRLRRLIYHVEDTRFRGIIEVVVSTDCGQRAYWEEPLKELGFVCVSERIKNSNSGEYLYVWHRYSGDVDKIKVSTLPKGE